MNKTDYIATISFEQPGDRAEAQAYLAKEYPGITYDAATDSYEYRGHKFDYFKAGCSVLPGRSNSYILIHQKTERWLFSYGDKEERWQELMARIIETKKVKKPGIIERIAMWLEK